MFRYSQPSPTQKLKLAPWSTRWCFHSHFHVKYLLLISLSSHTWSPKNIIFPFDFLIIREHPCCSVRYSPWKSRMDASVHATWSETSRDTSERGTECSAVLANVCWCWPAGSTATLSMCSSPRSSSWASGAFDPTFWRAVNRKWTWLPWRTAQCVTSRMSGVQTQTPRWWKSWGKGASVVSFRLNF